MVRETLTEDELTPAVVTLLKITGQLVEIADQQQEQIDQQQEQIHLQREQIQGLKDEVARLKGQKPKPKIKPSKMDEKTEDPGDQKGAGSDKPKRPGSAKRSKTKELPIHRTVNVAPPNLPPGSTFEGYSNWTVQDLIIEARNTLFRLECWRAPDGKLLKGALPKDVIGHCGSTLLTFVLYQHYHAHVTQPLLLEQLREWGVDLSSGKLSQILIENKERFHQEKNEILRVGLEVSRYVNVDDTGARHQGKNGYCTNIGSELFAWFSSTGSKSRINFLELLRAGQEDYVLHPEAIAYMRQQGLPGQPLRALETQSERSFGDIEAWKKNLSELGVTKSRHIRIATEGALLGSVLEHGWNPELVIVSDDAGQFNILRHALCWIHAERLIHKLVGFNDEQRAALEAARSQIWDFYADLKRYKKAPTAEAKAQLETRFDTVFVGETCFATLNLALTRLHKNKAELLLVLDRPDIPLHNNDSERDIRDYVKKRKISGSTRSDLGRSSRDTFASLKKTCRKLGVSFWQYLKDRISGSDTVSQLPQLIRQRAQAP